MDNEVLDDGDLTYDELLADLVRAETQTLPDRFFTLKEFAEKVGRSVRAATRILRERVDAGELASDLRIVNEARTRIYWFPEDREETRQSLDPA